MSQSQVLCDDYEYAGFHYTIEKRGNSVFAVPLPGQAAASSRSKHLWAALESYFDEIDK